MKISHKYEKALQLFQSFFMIQSNASTKSFTPLFTKQFFSKHLLQKKHCFAQYKMKTSSEQNRCDEYPSGVYVLLTVLRIRQQVHKVVVYAKTHITRDLTTGL